MLLPALFLSLLETKSMFLYRHLVAGPITYLPDTVFGWPTTCLGVSKAATNAGGFCMGKTRHCENAANQ